MFDKGVLNTTQNLKLGVLRLRERLGHINTSPSRMEELIEELDDAQLSVLYKLYLKDKNISNIILVDDYLSPWLKNGLFSTEAPGYVSAAQCGTFVQNLRERSTTEIAAKLGITEENAGLMFISAILVNRILTMTGAEQIWVPGATLCDGIAYEYGQKQKLVVNGHDFEKDILDCALQISKRYMGSRKRAETLESLTMNIFDNTKNCTVSASGSVFTCSLRHSYMTAENTSA